MAIELNLESSQFGVPFSAAYFRIATASITRQRDGSRSVMIDVVGYATKPTNEDTRDVDFRRYHTPVAEVEGIPGDDFVAKCYGWVMSQSDMSGSEKC